MKYVHAVDFNLYLIVFSIKDIDIRLSEDNKEIAFGRVISAKLAGRHSLYSTPVILHFFNFGHRISTASPL
jgi:hypothetical protein